MNAYRKKQVGKMRTLVGCNNDDTSLAKSLTKQNIKKIFRMKLCCLKIYLL